MFLNFVAIKKGASKTKALCNLFETDFTLTDGCRRGIINSWHYSKPVGAKLWKQQT